MDKFVSYFAPFGVLIAIISGIYYYKNLGKPQRVIFYYALYSGLSNASHIYMVRVLHHKSQVSVFVSNIIWFSFLTYFYTLLFKGKSRNVLFPIVAAYAVFATINILFIQKLDSYNNYTSTLSAVILIIYAMIYIYRQNLTDIDTIWGHQSLNWLNTGILLYYSTALVMYVTYAFMTNWEIGKWIWGLHNIVLITMYFLFFIGFKNARRSS
ncbi:MAG: hypothetical protein EOP46_03625 [Sphingobacteriaceae bacterium]|nr:MAG: hypothetical protein EOP46_03625 [Sphingobacteriaceae bacterium]